MGQLSPGLAAYIASQKKAKTPAKTPAQAASVNTDHGMEMTEPVVAKLPPQMVHAIKNSRKGQVPPGLARYMANKKQGK